MKKSFKDYKIKEDLPEDVKVALKSFLRQANIIEEYDLDFMPMEYWINLIKVLSKYPEYHNLIDECTAMIIGELGFLKE